MTLFLFCFLIYLYEIKTIFLFDFYLLLNSLLNINFLSKNFSINVVVNVNIISFIILINKIFLQNKTYQSFTNNFLYVFLYFYPNLFNSKIIFIDFILILFISSHNIKYISNNCMFYYFMLCFNDSFSEWFTSF